MSDPGENATHGLKRSNADKRKAVETLLKDAEWRQWSDSRIAEAAGVTHPMVADARSRLEESSSQPVNRTRIGKDGRTVNTAKIGAKQKADPPADAPKVHREPGYAVRADTG